MIQYYYQNPDARQDIDGFKLSGLRAVEKAIGADPPETLSISPMEPLYDACRMMLSSRARRIPLIDSDDETNEQMVLSVLTQYRILKFVAVNVSGRCTNLSYQSVKTHTSCECLSVICE